MELDPREVWFLKLRHRDDPSSLGLRMAMPGFVSGRSPDPYINAAWRIVDGLLGERRAATTVKRIFVSELPSDPKAQGYSHISNLPDQV